MRRGESDTGVTLPRAPAWPSVSWAMGIQPLTPTMQASEDRDWRTPVPTGLPGGGPSAPGAGLRGGQEAQGWLQSGVWGSRPLGCSAADRGGAAAE